MINCKQLAYVTMGIPDLTLMERFLTDFGMCVSARTEDTLYMRGAGSSPYIYVAKYSKKNKIISFAFEAATEEDLQRASEINGASNIEDITMPGGGQRVRLITPGGFNVEVVYGQQTIDELPLRKAYALNFSDKDRRFNTNLRPNKLRTGTGHKVGTFGSLHARC